MSRSRRLTTAWAVLVVLVSIITVAAVPLGLTDVIGATPGSDAGTAAPSDDSGFGDAGGGAGLGRTGGVESGVGQTTDQNAGCSSGVTGSG